MGSLVVSTGISLPSVFSVVLGLLIVISGNLGRLKGCHVCHSDASNLNINEKWN